MEIGFTLILELHLELELPRSEVGVEFVLEFEWSW